MAAAGGGKPAGGDVEAEAVEQGGAFLRWLISPVGASGTFDWLCMRDLSDVRMGHGRCTCRWAVTPRIANRYGTLHGGAIASAVDLVGSAALVTKSGIARSGVTLELNTSFLAPAPLGVVVVIDAQVLKAGGAIGVIQVDVRREDTGELIAQGRHSKFLLGTPGDALRQGHAAVATTPRPPAPSSPAPPGEGFAPWPQAQSPHNPESVAACALAAATLEDLAGSGLPPPGADTVTGSFTDLANDSASRDYDSAVMYGVRAVCAAPGRLRAAFGISARHRNRYGTLHGGAMASLTDSVAVAAALTASGGRHGATLELGLSYVNGAPGEPYPQAVEVDATVVRVGRSLATVAVEIRRATVGSHAADLVGCGVGGGGGGLPLRMDRPAGGRVLAPGMDPGRGGALVAIGLVTIFLPPAANLTLVGGRPALVPGSKSIQLPHKPKL